ncbi:hypothetical protein PXW64_00705 [Klebsiella pneumoniae]|uniref:hypothetical protein n=1 Tax=Klebsiella pneumoniae TaxID=573 RepID=UPI002380CFEA|nr:hypothetical protein [Klebsiella pneumoniae]MDE4632830.1 hypothetical protein [Klebsiella pneumoniae]
MTSKLTSEILDDETLAELIAFRRSSVEYCQKEGLPYQKALHDSMMLALEELQERRKADSEPVAVVEPSDYVTAAQIVGEGPARKAVHELYEGALRIGDKLYRHAQPVPVVPEDVRQALSKMDDEIIAELDAEESARRAAMDSEPVKVTDDMVLAFHRALTDGPLGADDAEKIKDGFRAAFANVATPQPAPEVLTVIDPGEWVPCSPEYLEEHPHACGKSPRVWSETDKNHYHPKNWTDKQPAPVVPEEATPESIEILASIRPPHRVAFQLDKAECKLAAEIWNACRGAMLSEPVSPDYRLPDGYVMVPKEPTMKMLDEFDSIIDYGAEDSVDAWRRLLASAPQEVKGE